MLAAPVGVNEAGDLAVFSVIPTSGPGDEATSDLVKSLREPDNDIAQANEVQLGVTGFTAIGIDMSDKLADVLPLYLAIIIVLSVLILMLVFRSIVVPLKATAGFLLSILATFGATTAVFQWGWLSTLFGFDTGGPLIELHADHRDRHPLRTRHGLRSFPGPLHARGTHPRPASPPERRPRVRPSQPGRRRRHHHGRGLLRLHLQPRHHDQADRLRPRRRPSSSTPSSSG